ncbi:GntR family transcriptional regulator [Microbacterium indicum]|uniref:GntR family transcriptional regulator n=1 Tax=Microbacterium indicum TaxID=358100 RepID=UPI0003FDF8E5|nr:GntR family transcriptional regulator [Microbacterium indicum]
MSGTSPAPAPRTVAPRHRIARRTHKHTAVAADIEADIAAGRFADGALPSESALAARFGVARGTVRRALEHLEQTAGVVSHQGTRWAAHPRPLDQDISRLRSFGQWAQAIGHTPGGRTVSSNEGRATAVEARELGVGEKSPVLRIVRLRSLDGDPVMVKRTTFPEWLIPTIARLPDDARSIMEVVERRHGPHQLAHGELRVSAMLPDAEDARLLGIARSAPLLRVQRAARTRDGRPFEYSDDRYVATATTLRFASSAESR